MYKKSYSKNWKINGLSNTRCMEFKRHTVNIKDELLLVRLSQLVALSDPFCC